jgi:peptidoglycan/LPS O-acetylase OafA/YrhL
MIERTQNRFDILRLFAAFCVLISHAYPISGHPEPDPFARWVGLDTLGGVGVIIFFVLSGYLVTLSWERSDGFRDFAWRRAVRIYPALLMLCVLTVLVLGPAVTEASTSDYFLSGMTWQYFKTATGLSIQYALPGVFTHNPLPNALNGSLWSLPYEIKCYFALVALSIFRGSLGARTGLAVILLAVMILQHPGHPPGNPFTNWIGLDYYHVKLGLPFAIGAFFAASSTTIKPRLWYVLAIFGAMLFFPLGTPAKTLLFLSGTSILSLYLALNGHWIPKMPESFGDWSYGVYLYGFPVQQFLTYIGLQRLGLSVYLFSCVAITVFFAAASWFCVEKPALKLKSRSSIKS